MGVGVTAGYGKRTWSKLAILNMLGLVKLKVDLARKQTLGSLVRELAPMMRDLQVTGAVAVLVVAKGSR